VIAPVLCEPLVGFEPLQPPEPVQAVALAEVQVSVEAPPLATAAGATVNVAVGSGATVTVTAPAVLLPAAPTQVIENLVDAVRAPVLRVPLGANGPVQPPAAVHAVASVEVQVNVDVPPAATATGLAVSVTVGAAVTVTVVAADVLPPAPVQVSENVVSASIDAALWRPAAGNEPVHPPDAAHEVALVEVHVNVVVPPLATGSGAAVRDAVGRASAAGLGVGVVPLPPHAASIRPRPINGQYLAVM
jgi:hypothetical protein